MNTPYLHKLIQVVKDLRHPLTGCPWDLEQTHESLLKYIIEESYEFIHSVEKKDFNEMKDELGDVLLQILLHAAIAEENKKFTLEDVAQNLAEKLIFRHPHVFKDTSVANSEEVVKNWDLLKEQENNNKGKEERLIDKKLSNFPSLYSAYKIGKKTNKIKFDWDDFLQVQYKVEEEWQELKEELSSTRINKARVEEELGDLLFSTAQLARHLDIEPEEALRKANKKFISRFQVMEDMINSDGQDITKMNQEQMDIYWNRMKQNEIKK